MFIAISCWSTMFCLALQLSNRTYGCTKVKVKLMHRATVKRSKDIVFLLSSTFFFQFIIPVCVNASVFLVFCPPVRNRIFNSCIINNCRLCKTINCNQIRVLDVNHGSILRVKCSLCHLILCMVCVCWFIARRHFWCNPLVFCVFYRYNCVWSGKKQLFNVFKNV